MEFDAATQLQIKAARPDWSTWLSANAGSGKTRVLTDRVARLLLEEVDPQDILCLTYTKAAASEMQNRLFRRLGAWAMLDNTSLTTELRKLGLTGDIPDDKLRSARKLFASAIETPGGLKIQTIHSFCAALLRRFPMEARVSPQFVEMDERSARLLRAEIAEDLAANAESTVFDDVARHYSGDDLDDLDDLTAEIIRARTLFQTERDPSAINRALGLSETATAEDALAIAFDGSEAASIPKIASQLHATGTKSYVALAEKLERVDAAAPSMADLDMLFGEFLYQSQDKKKDRAKWASKSANFPQSNHTKARTVLEPVLAELHAFMDRVAAAKNHLLALDAAGKARALHAFAQAYIPAYDQAKQLRGLLDFDDLILKARDLLTDRDVAAWVLFRLDGTIDHILVDEAQDTSPVQWEVIERLAQEFTSGKGARGDRIRTIFVVGDKKQSIYSFQGADPREFDRMQADFAARLRDTPKPLQELEMEYSFRSSNAILSLVDLTFQNAEKSGFVPGQSHKAHKSKLPGRVDLWPYILKDSSEDPPPWHMPVDVKAANDPDTVLARDIADTIKHLIDSKHPIPESDARDGVHPARPIQAGDFLILVQRRSELFYDIIRECKERDLPIAGADRLRVGAELAVRDIAALLSFLAIPEDSYSLAVALKSPLFGWSEADLYRLAQPRASDYLWQALRDQKESYPETLRVLWDLLEHADFLRPYDLIERILTRHHGRHNLLSRLGSEAEEGIDALLAQAMTYEQKSVDSLTGFLVWLETDELEIKRQIDSAGNLIRVMTVHGAKGLEAPIVILPETGKRQIMLRDQIIAADGTALWRTSSDASPQRIKEATEDIKQAERAERDRLLYVAMTRAEKWLIVGAAGEPGKDGDTWYEKINAGMEAAGAVEHEFSHGQGLRLEYGNWAKLETEHLESPKENPVVLDALFDSDITAPNKPIKPLSPSELGGRKALPGEHGLDEDAAKRRGRQIHRLLEFLPNKDQHEWPETAAGLLKYGGDAASGEELALLLAEAQKVLTKPSLAHLFDRSALAEVPVTASLEALGGKRIHGVIDRLLVTDDQVLAVDFKTNALVPETAAQVPDALLRQMGAYAHALRLIYPQHEIQTAILWTRTATLMSLPHDIVTDALITTQIS